MKSLLGVLGTFALVVVIAGVPFAQTPAPDPDNALLAEVRALRAELSQFAGASIGTQLLTARLQLQEQRIYTAARQLTEVQDQLATLRQEILTGQQGIEQMESDVRSSTQPISDDTRNIIAQRRARLEQQQQREQELRAQETGLFNTIDAEQVRWAELSSRLDEVERSLGPVGGR